jgi:hypothetical protein
MSRKSLKSSFKTEVNKLDLWQQVAAISPQRYYVFKSIQQELLKIRVINQEKFPQTLLSIKNKHLVIKFLQN